MPCNRSRELFRGAADATGVRSAVLSEGGFTLMEVVVALAILGIGLVVLLESHYGSMRLYADAQEQAVSDALLIEAIGIAEQSALTGDLTGAGEFGLRYPEYSWTYTTKTLSGNGFPGLVEITLTLRTPVGDITRVFMTHDGRQNTDATEARELLRR